MEELAVAAQYQIPFVIALMKAFGCPARRVTHPDEIASALAWARTESTGQRLPALVEVTQ